MSRNFWELVSKKHSEKKSVCLELTGMPPEWDDRRLGSSSIAIEEFSQHIITATHMLVAAYYLKLSSYLQRGLIEGGTALMRTLQYIHARDPAIPIVLDGMSAEGSKEDLCVLFKQMKADAIIVHLPPDSPLIDTLFAESEKGIFLVNSPEERQISETYEQKKQIGFYSSIPRLISSSHFEVMRDGCLHNFMWHSSLSRLGEEFDQSVRLKEDRTPNGFARFVRGKISEQNKSVIIALESK